MSPDLIQRHLAIVAGNMKDVSNVSQTLFHPSAKGGVVDCIVSGVGGAPVFTPNPLRPTLDDPTICQDATSTVLKSLKAGLKPNSNSSKKPVFIVISTTGMSDYGRDIPIAMIPLYHWLLPVPHADKKKMEEILAHEAQSAESSIAGFVVLRASLLTTGPELGVEKVRADTEQGGKVAKKAIGYTISRNDVGNWIYEKLVAGHEKNEASYLNQNVTITY